MQPVAASAPIAIQHVDEGLDRINLKQINLRFSQINQVRLLRLRSALSASQQVFLDLLPLLFHINHPVLPGYMPAGTPTGLRNYKPTRESIKSARQLAKSFVLKRDPNASSDLCAIYLMGSCGTIAHSSDSDIDIWICPADHLETEQLSALKEKCRQIELWASSLKLEVHFFVMSDAAFMEKRRADMGGEDCGNTQHYLLLDEFYRTSILLAGCLPIWWLTPDDFESEYQHYVDTLKQKRFVDAQTYIDYGSAKTIPAEEYLSAGIWHLYKSLASPYKAALKLLLIEVYASEHPHTNNLSSEYKRLVYSGQYDIDELDPYLLIYRRIETYLLARDDQQRLELLRRCFYFKVGVALSKSAAIEPVSTASDALPLPGSNHDSGPDSDAASATTRIVETDHRHWQRQLMHKLTQEWGWTRKHIHYLDQRQQWTLQELQAEQNSLTKQLTQCYRLFAGLIDQNEAATGEQRHNSRELTLLGRQIYAAFEKKTDKINVVQRGLVNSLAQAHISFSAQRDEAGQCAWSVEYNSLSVANKQSDKTPNAIKTASNPVELLCWCIANDLVDEATRIHVVHGDHDLSEYEVRQLQSALLQQLSRHKAQLAAEPGDRNFARPANVTHCVFVINAGVDPLKDQKESGVQRVSAKTDPLSFSGVQENLIANITHIAMNSWGEIFCYHFDGKHAIDECITHYFSYANPEQEQPLPGRNIICACPTRPTAISERLETLFDDIEACYFDHEQSFDQRRRYLFESADAYHVLGWQDDNLAIRQYDSDQTLLASLSDPDSAGPMMIDRFALTQHPLHTIYRTLDAANAKLRNKSSSLIDEKNIIRVFYEVDGKNARTYFIDNQQALYLCTIPFESTRSLILPLSQFIALSASRRAQHDSQQRTEKPGIEFYALTETAGQYSCRQVPTESEISAQYLPIKAFGSRTITGDIAWKINCNEQSFDSATYGEDLFAKVAQAIKDHRRSGQSRYRCYITDIDISACLPAPDLAHELHYKLALEAAINDAFASFED